MRHLFAALALLALAGPAVACINDTELINHEREFRSQYKESEYRPPQPDTVATSRPYLLGGAGVLMACLGGVVLYRLRPQA